MENGLRNWDHLSGKKKAGNPCQLKPEDVETIYLPKKLKTFQKQKWRRNRIREPRRCVSIPWRISEGQRILRESNCHRDRNRRQKWRRNNIREPRSCVSIPWRISEGQKILRESICPLKRKLETLVNSSQRMSNRYTYRKSKNLPKAADLSKKISIRIVLWMAG